MTSSKKRRTHNGTNDPSDGDDDDNISDTELPEEDLQVDFEAYNPTDEDFDGIKQLLQQMFLKAHVDLSEMTELIIEQANVTSVLKSAIESENEENDEDDENYVFGVASVLNLTLKRDKNCIKELMTYLLTKCRDVCSTEECSRFQNFLEDSKSHIGFIINERLINIPAQISVPIFDSLTVDMRTADVNNSTKKFDFQNYLIISKISVDKTSARTVEFINAEEKEIMEDIVFKFDFSVSDEKDSLLSGDWTEDDMEFESKRRVMIFPKEKWDGIINRFKLQFAP